MTARVPSHCRRSITRSPSALGRWLVGLAFTCVLTGTALGQREPNLFINQQRILEEQLRQRMDTQVPPDRKTDLEWGGWYSFHLFLFDDGVNSSRTYRRNDLRLWSSLSLDQGAHTFYVRGKLQYHDFNSGDSYDRNDNDWLGPNLDRGYYEFDLRNAAQAYGGERPDWNFKFRIGRAYTQFGTGYVLSMPLDQVLLTGEFGGFELQGLMATAIRSTDNLDLSHPDWSHSERNFWGVQLAYTDFERHRPFVYVLWNEDQLSELRVFGSQNWDYDSLYVGFGSEGELLSNLRYSTEWVIERGETYGDREGNNKDDIEAWAFDAELEYLSQKPMRPRISLEYMFASGDSDRFGHPTNSVGGNTFYDDTGFNAFGYRDTGLAFAPSLSNVHIWRAGFSFLPFDEIEALKHLELGTDWFLFHKHHGDGAVSDFTADQRSGYLGWEMDYYVNWRITSDLSWTSRLGTFFPGQAFSDRTTRTFWMTGVTWSF